MRLAISNRCPLCGGGGLKIIYAGFPMKLCRDEECSCIWGFWSWWLDILPFNGLVYVYSDNYFSALLRWLKG